MQLTWPFYNGSWDLVDSAPWIWILLYVSGQDAPAWNSEPYLYLFAAEPSHLLFSVYQGTQSVLLALSCAPDYHGSMPPRSVRIVQTQMPPASPICNQVPTWSVILKRRGIKKNVKQLFKLQDWNVTETTTDRKLATPLHTTCEINLFTHTAIYST
jgi:hypothetical protein